MSTSILVGYATRYGSTQEVAQAIAETLQEGGYEVTLQPLREVKSLEGCRAVVMGAPLFMFHWHKEALSFLSKHRKALLERRTAVFALGPVHEPYDEAEWKDSQVQLEKELGKHPWFNPIEVKMFGGKYDPAKLGFPIKLFAGEAPASDIRDWQSIRAWAQSLGKILGVDISPPDPSPAGSTTGEG